MAEARRNGLAGQRKGSGMKEWIKAQRDRKKPEPMVVSEVADLLEGVRLDLGQRVQHNTLRADDGTALIGAVACEISSNQVGIEWHEESLGTRPGVTQVVEHDESSRPPWERNRNDDGGSKRKPDQAKTFKHWASMDAASVTKECGLASAIQAKYAGDLGEAICVQPLALNMLKSVELRCSGISSLQDFSPSKLPNLAELDLSCNMLQNYGEIADFARAMQSLRSLNISENRLAPDTIRNSLGEASTSVSGVQSLILNRIPGLSWGTLIHFLTDAGIRPKELSLSHNSFDGVDAAALPFLINATLLRFDHNLIQSWSNVLCVATLPWLSSLILSSNPLKDLWYPAETTDDAAVDHAAQPEAERRTRAFLSLTSLSLSDTCLSSWAHVDALARFPSLREVRLQNIPLLSGIDQDSARMLLISHLPNVCAGGQGRQTVGSETCGRVNGGMATATERRDAHRFFLEYYAPLPASSRPARYRALLEEEPLLARLAEEEGGGSAGDGGEGVWTDVERAESVLSGAESVLHNGTHASSFDARGLGRCM